MTSQGEGGSCFVGECDVRGGGMMRMRMTVALIIISHINDYNDEDDDNYHNNNDK